MTAALAPLCASCARRHSPELPCWTGRRIQAHLQAVLAEYGDECCHCHQAGCDSVEHVRPRSRWGDDSLHNTRPSHIPCNARRGVRPMSGWDERPVTHSQLVARLVGTPDVRTDVPTTSRKW